MSRLSHNITIDTRADTIEIFGTKYALEVFRALGFGPVGTVFKIVKRTDGTLTLHTIEWGNPEASGAAVPNGT
jgi:hypothetical protein